MPGRKQLGSTRSKRSVRSALDETWDGVLNVIKSLNTKLKNGKALRDEEIRFLKNAQELIKTLESKDEAITKEEMLPEGTLKTFVERAWQQQAICKDPNQVIEFAGYYICDYCGQLHLKGRECMWLEYKKQHQTESNTIKVDQNELS